MKNPKELLALAKEEDVKLTEEQLEAINGGAGSLKFGPKIWKASFKRNSN